VRTEFKKSFARDLQARKNDKRFLDSVKEIIEHVEHADTIGDISNLKKLKGESNYYRIRFGNYRIGGKGSGKPSQFHSCLAQERYLPLFPLIPLRVMITLLHG